MFDPEVSTKTGPSSKVDVDVILEMELDTDIVIRTDETAKPIVVSRKGVKVTKKEGKLATLRLSEAKAVYYNLV